MIPIDQLITITTLLKEHYLNFVDLENLYSIFFISAHFIPKKLVVTFIIFTATPPKMCNCTFNFLVTDFGSRKQDITCVGIANATDCKSTSCPPFVRGLTVQLFTLLFIRSLS